MNAKEEEELCGEITQLKGKLEAAYRKIRDLEHSGIHRLVVRELTQNRNLDIRETNGVFTISAGKNRAVERRTLHDAVAAAWEEFVW
jgi:hypothetical protein